MILVFLFNVHRKAGTIEGSKFQITELKRELKELGLAPAEIARNLDYLVQNEWILRDSDPYVMTRGGSTISSKRVTYRISSKGIDLFQGPSAGRDAFRSSVPERDGGKCVICGSRNQLEVDHILEFWRGGANEPRNGHTLCMGCHGLKTRPRNAASWHTFAKRYAAVIARLGFRAEYGMCSLHGHHYLISHAIVADKKPATQY